MVGEGIALGGPAAFTFGWTNFAEITLATLSPLVAPVAMAYETALAAATAIVVRYPGIWYDTAEAMQPSWLADVPNRVVAGVVNWWNGKKVQQDSLTNLACPPASNPWDVSGGI